MIFCMKISIKVFYKIVVSFLLIIARHAQSTQNSKFVISVEYLKKKRRDEVDCLHVDKHKTILQVHKINLQSFAKYLRLTLVLLFSCDIEGKVQFLFFRRLLLVLTKASFREQDWALGNNSTKFWDFPDIFKFPKILSHKGTLMQI